VARCALCKGIFESGIGKCRLKNSDAEICRECAALLERKDMIETGVAGLYLEETKREVTDWMGGLQFRVTAMQKSMGRGFGGARVPRIDFRFTGPLGEEWYGRVQGDMQLARCKRLVKG